MINRETTNKILATICFTVPLIVGSALVIGDCLIPEVTGKPLLGIEPVTGAMLMLLSFLLIPIGYHMAIRRQK